MQNRQKKESTRKRYLKLSSDYWTSTTTPKIRFYKNDDR